LVGSGTSYSISDTTTYYLYLDYTVSLMFGQIVDH